MSISTAIIDDSTSAINRGKQSIMELPAQPLALVWDVPIQFDDAYDQWAEWCGNSAPQDLVVILDLSLEIDGGFKTVKEMIKEDLTFPNQILSQQAQSGICAGLEAIRSTRLKRLLVIIASSTGKSSVSLNFLRARASQCTDKEVHIEYSEEGCTLLDDSNRVLSYALRKWNEHFPEFHSDAWIDNCISKWINRYRAFVKENKQNEFCQHGKAGGSSTIDANESLYIDLLKSMFGLDPEIPLVGDLNGVKALLVLSAKPTEATGTESLYLPWDWEKPNLAGRKPIASSFLLPFLQAAFGHKVNISGKQLLLPSVPALPFLIALRVLFNALRSEPGGSILCDNSCVTIEGEFSSDREVNYRLSIPLKKDARHRFGLSSAWLRKIGQGGNLVANNGICGSIWCASLAKVEISTGAVNDNTEMTLLGIFDGAGRIVVGVRFAPHYIHLDWS